MSADDPISRPRSQIGIREIKARLDLDFVVGTISLAPNNRSLLPRSSRRIVKMQIIEKLGKLPDGQMRKTDNTATNNSKVCTRFP